MSNHSQARLILSTHSANQRHDWGTFKSYPLISYLANHNTPWELIQSSNFLKKGKRKKRVMKKC